MIDPERIQRLAAKLGDRNDALEFVRQMRCGGRKFDGGGKYFRTSLENESPLMYDPILPSVPDVPVPVRYEPLPHYGLYEYPTSTGMAQNYPVNVGYVAPNPGYGVAEPVAVPVSSGLDPVKDAARRIMAVENSKTNPEGGWNEKEQRWYPHKSYEGGADTIAYGIKLSNGTPEAQLALEQGYLTDEQATHFADTLAQRYYDAAKRVYDRKYGAGEWDKLSDWSQSILTDFSYNPGLGKYPKLMEGFHSGDMDAILSEYKRYSGGQELGRNKIIREELDTLGTEHPIFRKDGGVLYGFGGKKKTKTPRYNPRTDTTTQLNDDPYVQEYFQYDVEPRYLREHNWTTEKERDALSNAYGNTPSSISADLEDHVMGQANFHPRVIASGIPLTGILNNIFNEEPDITYNQNYGDPRRSTVVHENTHILRQQGISDATITGGANHEILGFPPIVGGFSGSGYNNPETDYLNEAYDLTNYDLNVNPGIWHNNNHRYREVIESGATNTELRYVLWRELYTKLGRRPTIEEMDDYISNYNEEQLMNRLRNQNGYGNESAKEQPDAGPVKDALIHVADADDTYLMDPNLAASGGKIHINPKNRGKFTALLKRTGKSASWFKAHGTPAQKKMAVFALNARKWKHGDGGYMNNYYDGETELTGQMDRIPNWKVRGSDYSMWNPSDIQEIINWGVTNPYSFFGDEGKETRDALNRAGMTEQVIGGIYDLLPRHQQWLYGYEYAPEKEKEEAFAEGVRNYRDTKGLGFTLGALSIPLAIMGGAEAAAGAGWLAANPTKAMAAGRFLAPMAGAASADAAMARYTPWGSWGQAVGDLSGIHDNPLYQYGLGDWGKEFVDTGLEFTHPAFMFPYEKAATGIAGAIGRNSARRQARSAVREMRNEFNSARRSEMEPYVIQGEPAEAFAVDTGPQATKGMTNTGGSPDVVTGAVDVSPESVHDPLRIERVRAWARQASDDELRVYREQLPTMRQYSPQDYPDEVFDIIDSEISSRQAALPFDVPSSRTTPVVSERRVVNPETGEVTTLRTTESVDPQTGLIRRVEEPERTALSESTRVRRDPMMLSNDEFETWVEDEASYDDLLEFMSNSGQNNGGAFDFERIEKVQYELDLRSNAGYLDGFGRPPRRVGEAPASGSGAGQTSGMMRRFPERQAAGGRSEGAASSSVRRYNIGQINEMSDVDLENLALNVRNGNINLASDSVGIDEVNGVLRNRGRAKLFDGKSNISELSDRELISAHSKDYNDRLSSDAINMANSGLDSTSADYLDSQRIRNMISEEMRNRILNSGYYSDMDTAMAHLEMARSLGEWRMVDSVENNSTNILAKYVIEEKNIPNDFNEFVPGVVGTLFNNGNITEGNKYVKDALSEIENQYKNIANQRLAKKYFSVGDSASDHSEIARDHLRALFRGKSDGELIKMLDEITPQMVHGDEPIPAGKEQIVNAIKKAYVGPKKYSSSKYDDLVYEKIGDILKERLRQKGVDINDLSVVFDVTHPDYVDTARKLRKSGISLLPADIRSMAMKEMVYPKERLLDGTYDASVSRMLSSPTVTEDVKVAFGDDFDKFSKKLYGKKLADLKKEFVDKSAFNQKLQQYWNEIRSNYIDGISAANEKQAQLLFDDEYDTKMWINFHDDFERMFMSEYGKPRAAVEESLSDYSEYNRRLKDLWREIRSDYIDTYSPGVNSADANGKKYIRKRAESLMNRDLKKSKEAAGLRQKLLDLAIPRQAGVAEHSASVQSYTSQITGVARGIKNGTYGTDAYQTAIMPLDPEYGKIDSGYLTGNNYQENRVVYDIDGTLRNYGNPGMDASLESFFNKKQFDDFIASTRTMTDRQFLEYIVNDPNARSIVEQVLSINRMLDEYNVRTASAPIQKINAVNGSFYGNIDLPSPEHPMPSTIEELVSTQDPWSIRRLISRTINEFDSHGGGFGGPGYATYMHRTPIIALRHKYGGMLDKMSSVYKNDKDSMILAIQNARKRKKR